MYEQGTESDEEYPGLHESTSNDEDNWESACSDLDDLETRLYSQIHYGEDIAYNGDVATTARAEEVKRAAEDKPETTKTGSQLLTDIHSAKRGLDDDSTESSQLDEASVTIDKKQEGIIEKSDPVSLKNSITDSGDDSDNSWQSQKALFIDRVGSEDKTFICDDEDPSIGHSAIVLDKSASADAVFNDSAKRTQKVEYVVIDDESDSNIVSRDKIEKDKQKFEKESDSASSDSDSSIEMVLDHAKNEYISLISEGEENEEDISVHANIESDQEKHLCDSPKPGSSTGADINAENNSLEAILDSLGDCDWSSNPDHKPAHINTRGRYYLTKRCDKCGGKGHSSRDCPNKVLICLQCGEKGHQSKRCTHSVCFNCLRTGHTKNDCTEPRRQRWKKCHTCDMQGHRAVECPNRWRQFHMTTDVNEPSEGKNTENKRVYCSNCGHEGHFYHDCIEEPMFGKQWDTWPFIVNYNLNQEINSLFAWRDRCINGLKDDSEDSKTKKAKSKKPKGSFSQTFTEDISGHGFLKKKGQKRKWTDDFDRVDTMSEFSMSKLGGKKRKIDPDTYSGKKKKEKQKKLKGKNENADFDFSRGKFTKKSKKQKKRDFEFVEETEMVKKKNKKKKNWNKDKKNYNKFDDKHVASQKRTHYMDNEHHSVSHRGFRYGQGVSSSGSVSHATHQAPDKAKKKWKKRHSQDGQSDRQKHQHWGGGSKKIGMKGKNKRFH